MNRPSPGSIKDGTSSFARFWCMKCQEHRPLLGSKVIGGNFFNQKRGRICARCYSDADPKH